MILPWCYWRCIVILIGAVWWVEWRREATSVFWIAEQSQHALWWEESEYSDFRSQIEKVEIDDSIRSWITYLGSCTLTHCSSCLSPLTTPAQFGVWQWRGPVLCARSPTKVMALTGPDAKYAKPSPEKRRIYFGTKDWPHNPRHQQVFPIILRVAHPITQSKSRKGNGPIDAVWKYPHKEGRDEESQKVKGRERSG
jgi:hypothetical protein